MKVNNLTRLTITLSTMCLASTLFCSANAHTKSEKATVLMETVSPKTVSSNDKLDRLVKAMHVHASASRDARNIMAKSALHYGNEDVRVMKALLQNSSFYMFNVALASEAPQASNAINNTLAYYQRQQTNILLRQLVAREHNETAKAAVPFSTGKNALYLYAGYGKRIPFFQFVYDFHAQDYVQQCMIPIVRYGDITLHQLHLTKHIFGVLASHGDDNFLLHSHHCRARSERLNSRLHDTNVYAVHAAALLTDANHAMANQHNNAEKMPVTDSLLARLRNAKAQWLLHPTVKSAGAYLKMRHSIEEADANIKKRIQKTEAYISQHNIHSNGAALAELKASLSDSGDEANLVHNNPGLISAKQITKVSKSVHSEKSNASEAKTKGNVNHVSGADLDRFFNSLGYSSDTTSPEVYKGDAVDNSNIVFYAQQK